ncbi:hypothetical protein BD289DRAFT_429737 [Coniella lustricola]|uniref:Uncharacterized protein n=1 Tax=Coniella lustricola TaxID=2025994 RepID=A0A2T3ACK8_9PEZI|nr:hypothetical protein BD289DRAFT_429737 [Coniella lustricola]
MNVLLAQPPVFPHQYENHRLSPSRGCRYHPFSFSRLHYVPSTWPSAYGGNNSFESQ